MYTDPSHVPDSYSRSGYHCDLLMQTGTLEPLFHCPPQPKMLHATPWCLTHPICASIQCAGAYHGGVFHARHAWYRSERLIINSSEVRRRTFAQIYVTLSQSTAMAECYIPRFSPPCFAAGVRAIFIYLFIYSSQ